MKKTAVLFSLLLIFCTVCGNDPPDPEGDNGVPEEVLLACPDGAFDIAPPEITSTYFVAPWGNDENDGRSRAGAFATIQAGVDALEPGDTLTIAPGEYFGTVRREEIGAEGVKTTIRAEIPGTVIMRGDIPAPPFRKVDGFNFVYEADLDFDDEIQAVNELDTLTIFEFVPDMHELEFSLGRFYQDQEARKLYISSSDGASALLHNYSMSMTNTHGFYLGDAVEVVVDGITATGFHSRRQIHQSDNTLRAVWGVFLARSTESVLRNVHVYFNAHGLGTNSRVGGGNLIEFATSRANGSHHGIGDIGGLTLIDPQSDTVRHSLSFRNRDYGINMRGESGDHTSVENRSYMMDSLAWGNGTDMRLKVGGSHVHQTIRMIAMNRTADSQFSPQHTIMGTTRSDFDSTTIVFDRENDLVLTDEFVDPENFDFRLQSTSRFRGAADDGSDRGPHPFDADVFFVSKEGSEEADGMSVSTAWRSLSQSVSRLSPGDTLYIMPGTYNEGFELNIRADEEAPVHILARGTEPVVLNGEVGTYESSSIGLERLHFVWPLTVQASKDITLRNHQFLNDVHGLQIRQSDGVRVEHSLFTGFERSGIVIEDSSEVFLVANLYDNAQGFGIRVDRPESIVYSDYNSFRRENHAWRVGDGVCGLDDIRRTFEHYSLVLAPELQMVDGVATLQNAHVFAGRSLNAQGFGQHVERIPTPEIRFITDPYVRSVSATTANIEWATSLPVRATIEWGLTEETENSVNFYANHFGNYSLQNLQPNTTYYVRIRSMRIPDRVDIEAAAIEPNVLLTFTTAANDPDPVTYFVSMDGDDGNDGTSAQSAFRSIQRAANNVAVGDTVLIQSGTYYESIRMRSTGAPGAPISFRAAPGAQVRLDGSEMALNQGFVIGGKGHLVFDGFQFANYNGTPLDTTGWMADRSAEFSITLANDITISRCISDGRGTSDTARTIVGQFIDTIHIHNCVALDKMSGSMLFNTVENFLMENSVILRPKISMLLIRNPGENVVLRRNIYTDMLRSKAENNGSFFQGSSDISIDESIFFLRAFTPETRNMFGSTAAHEVDGITNPIFIDPIFQGALDLQEAGINHDFMPDAMVGRDIDYDFDFFMATDPEATTRGIGLDPSQFENGLPR